MKIMLFLLSACAFGQSTHLLTVIPDMAKTVVGKVGLQDKNATPHTIFLQAPNSLSADRTITFPGSLGTAGDCIKDNGAGGWYHDSCGSGTATLPFSDVSALLMNDSDNTKTLRFDLGALSTATLRVIGVPDSDFTMAGLDNVQTFTAEKDFSGSAVVKTSDINGAGMLELRNTYSTAISKYLRTNAYGTFSIVNSAYTADVLELTDAGNLNSAGGFSIGGIG